MGQKLFEKGESISLNEEKQPNVLLLTGPNMGGKSTLLR
jgi:DNA mismatch repair ATPase MutS